MKKRIFNRPRRAVTVAGTIFLVLFWAAVARTAFQAFVVVHRIHAQASTVKKQLTQGAGIV